MLLPASLLSVLQSFLLLVEAQSPLKLSLDVIWDLNTANLLNPPTFSIPATADLLYVSVALCANSEKPPRFFVTNDTAVTQPGLSDVDNAKVFEIVVGPNGFGRWSGMFTNGGVLSILKDSTATPFEMLISTTNSTIELDSPHFGDSTSNQALIFSPPFAPPPIDQPSYPNYTLPSANLTFPSEPSSPLNYSLVFASTASSSLNYGLRTNCAIRAAAQRNKNTITVLTNTQSIGMWLRDTAGWRWQWLVAGLTPQTNYTAFALQDRQLAASKPINFVTKSASFNCPLVHSLPFCPGTSYAAPLAAPRAPATAHTASTLPSAASSTLISALANFTATLTTLACGRDHYSPLVTCADCQRAYRTWLCTVAFPRCGEALPSASVSTSPSPQIGASDGNQTPLPLPALQPVKANTPPRSPILPAFSADYQTLLPCLETCNAADRACPAFLGFTCPLPRFTAARSYGVGFVDSGNDGQVGGGSTGAAQDEFGNVWCNTG